MAEFKRLCDMEVMEMRQRAEEEWIIFGDKYSKVFHRILKAKKNKSTICDIEDSNGVVFSG